MKKATRTELIEHLTTLFFTASQCQVDILISKDTDMIQVLDFSAFHDGIWPKERSSNIFDAVSGSLYDELTKVDDKPFSACITSLTFIEIIESLSSELVDLKNGNYSALDAKIAKIRSTLGELNSGPIFGNEHQIDIRQEYISEQLRTLDRVAGKALSSAIGRSLKLLGPGGPVVGLGDVFGSSLSQMVVDHDEINRLSDLMWETRSSKDQRSSDEKEFRYWVDAMNIHVVNKLRPLYNSRQTSYVSRANHIKYIEAELGRTPLVPLFWLRIHNNDEFITLLEKADFFGSMADQAEKLNNRVQIRDSVPKVGERSYKLLENFNELYLAELDAIIIPGRKKHDAEGDKLLTDTHYVRKEFDRNIARAETRLSRLITEFGGIRGDDLVEKGDARRIKYYQDLIKTLRKGFSSL